MVGAGKRPFLCTAYVSSCRIRPNGGYEPLADNAPIVGVSNITVSAAEFAFVYAQPPNARVQAAELLEDHCSDVDPEALPPLTTSETAKLAGWFCLLWFIANWALALALRYTTVASATILSSMSGMSLFAAALPNITLSVALFGLGFFTLAVGRLFRVETLTLVKIFAVCTRSVHLVPV